MKDPKKQKAKTYERRKKEKLKKEKKELEIKKQIDNVQSEIDDFKLTVASKKIDLFFKLAGGAASGVAGAMFPLSLISSDSDNLNEFLSDFIYKVKEQPIVSITPIIGFGVSFTLLEFILCLNNVSSFSEIKEAFKYNKELLDKKSELESKLNRKNYKDADREISYQKTKTKK